MSGEKFDSKNSLKSVVLKPCSGTGTSKNKKKVLAESVETVEEKKIVRNKINFC